jgi:sugar (pentulose or hexulose) kinase
MNQELIAAVDIGKTHAKLLLIEAASGEIRWMRQRPCSPVQGPLYRQLDIAGIEEWLINSLASAEERSCIRHLVPIAHGAAAVLIDEDGESLAALDYEDPVFASNREGYDALRDSFSQTFSPLLSLGLNLGRQLYFLQHRHASLWDRVRWILLYPQYWAWRFSGVLASEFTSLGCHSDLWRPQESRFSDMARQRRWDQLIPALRPAGAVLGPISQTMAYATGLDASCRVYCGIHDSNASYLCHLVEQLREGPTQSALKECPTVISSGTWTIVLAPAAPLSILQETSDMLANIDAFGHPVATARFMGGREFAVIAGPEARELAPDSDMLGNVLAKNIMALPSFASEGGPFAHRQGLLVHGECVASPAERVALATLYTALMSDLLLDNLGVKGNVIIDGPLTRNLLYGRVLQTLRPAAQVSANNSSYGAAAAARFLVTGAPPSRSHEICAPCLKQSAALEAHRRDWRSIIAHASAGETPYSATRASQI